jgi:hypothetical protein
MNETSSLQTQCLAFLPDGTRCQNAALFGWDYCPLHSYLGSGYPLTAQSPLEQREGLDRPGSDDDTTPPRGHQ